jgi:MFS family permease
MFGLFLFLTYYLQLVKHFSPVTSGLAFLPMIACVMISSNTANIITLPRFGPRVVITVGMTTGFLGLGYLSRITVHSSYISGVLPALVLMGLAMGMVMAPSMNTATAGVAPQDSGVAAALVSTMQQVGGSIGTAVLSTIAASVTTSYAASHSPVRGFDALAATHGYATVFLVSAGVFAVGAVLAAALFPTKARLTAMRESAMPVAETVSAELGARNDSQSVEV